MGNFSISPSRRYVAVGISPFVKPHLKSAMLGIRRYAVEHRWRLTSLYMVQHAGSDPSEGRMGRIEGLIAGDNPGTLPKVLARPCPKVILGQLARDAGACWVWSDYAAVGRLGVEHLLSRGYQHIGLFNHGDTDRRDARDLRAGAEAAAEAGGATFAEFTNGPRTQQRGTWRLVDQRADLADFLITQSQPIGLLCFDDEHAFRALEVCREAGLAVPQHVGIVGVGDDEFICAFAHPMISSVALDLERIGYEAAARLDELMKGEQASMETLIAPTGVVMRESSGRPAVADREIRAALDFIYENLADDLSLDRLAGEVQVSTRTLTRRFRDELGRAPGQVVREARVDEARRLITLTDLGFQDIAIRTGLGAVSQFGHTIKSVTGFTPGQLRRTARKRS